MKLTPDAPFPPSLCYSLRLFPLVLIIPSTPPGPPEIIANEPGRNLLRGNAAGMSICGGGGHRRALPCAAPGRHQRPAIATIPSSRRYDPRPPPFSFSRTPERVRGRGRETTHASAWADVAGAAMQAWPAWAPPFFLFFYFPLPPPGNPSWAGPISTSARPSEFPAHLNSFEKLRFAVITSSTLL
jgi:hypothetical protein